MRPVTAITVKHGALFLREVLVDVARVIEPDTGPALVGKVVKLRVVLLEAPEAVRVTTLTLSVGHLLEIHRLPAVLHMTAGAGQLSFA